VVEKNRLPAKRGWSAFRIRFRALEDEKQSVIPGARPTPCRHYEMNVNP